MSQKINRKENPIVFLTVFDLFTRIPNVWHTKSLYLSQNFVFYIFLNLQVNNLKLSIYAVYPPLFKVVQLIVYWLTYFYNSKNFYLIIQLIYWEGEKFHSSLLNYFLSFFIHSNSSVSPPNTFVMSRHLKGCQKTCCIWLFEIC